MNRKKKIVIAMAGSASLVAILLASSPTVRLLFETPSLSHWPQVPPPELYVFTRPKLEDVAGVYHLTRQTITTDGLAVLEGRLCQLDLRPDGSFTAANYPLWAPDTNSTPQIAEFVSTAGRWRCDTVNIMYHGHDCWGVVFSDAKGKGGIDPLALRRKGAPYDLMLTYGDGDDGTFMVFGKEKSEGTRRSPAAVKEKWQVASAGPAEVRRTRKLER